MEKQSEPNVIDPDQAFPVILHFHTYYCVVIETRSSRPCWAAPAHVLMSPRPHGLYNLTLLPVTVYDILTLTSLLPTRLSIVKSETFLLIMYNLRACRTSIKI